MKTKIYLLFLLMIPMLSLQAVTTTFYVNSSSLAASDENAGTSPTAPWMSLNPTKWVEGCVVMLSPGVHSVLQTANVTMNVTLQGTSKTDVIIEGLSADDITRGSESPQFFQVNGAVTLTVKDVSLRNFVSTVDMWGGMFNVSATSTLTLQNVNMTNAKLPKNGGAAIYSDGTLNLTNVSFEDCLSSIGAAICIQGTGVATIENAIFKNNSTNDGFDGFKFGGAIHVNSTTANITINNSFFDSNKCTNATSDPNNFWPVGGAIAFRVFTGYSSKLHVTNTTFNKNFAAFQGGAIEIHKNGTFEDSNLDLFFANNTFIENSINNMHGQVFAINGGNDANFKGNLSFVNNTFMHNGPAVPTGDYSSFFFNDIGLSLNVINNVMREKVWNANLQKFFGWGFVLNNGGGSNYAAINFKGNVFDAVGGWLLGSTYDQIYGSDNIEGANAVDSVLTFPTTGVPYLAISNPNSIAVNKGFDEFTFNGKNIVPSTDVRAAAKYGASKDAGAFEYTPATSVQNILDKAAMFAYPNPFRDLIVLNKEVASISIYDLAGKKKFSASNVDKVNVASLQAGLYLVCVVNLDGTVLSQKMQK